MLEIHFAKHCLLTNKSKSYGNQVLISKIFRIKEPNRQKIRFDFGGKFVDTA